MDFSPLKSFPIQLYAVILAYIVISVGVVSFLKAKFCIKTAYSRKIFHFSIFFLAAITHFLYGIWATVFLGLVVFIVVCLTVLKFSNSYFYKSLARLKDAPYESLFIIIPLITTAVGGIISHLIFPGFAFIGYLIGGIADAIAEPVGYKWGKHTYKVHSIFASKATRSIEGSIAVLISSMLILYPVFRFLSYSSISSITNALIVAVVVTIVEAYSTHGFDNLTVQLSAAGMSYYLLT